MSMDGLFHGKSHRKPWINWGLAGLAPFLGNLHMFDILPCEFLHREPVAKKNIPQRQVAVSTTIRVSMCDIYYMSRRSSVYVSRNFNHYIIVQCSDGFHWLSLDYIRSFSNLLEEAANFLTVKAVLCLSTIHIYLIVYRFVHVLFFSPSRNLEAYTFLLDGFPMFLSRKSPVDGGFSAATGSTGHHRPRKEHPESYGQLRPQLPRRLAEKFLSARTWKQQKITRLVDTIWV